MVSIRVGDVLSGKYRIERELGAGGMGVVVEATQLRLERRVAIKVLSVVDDAARARLMREARAAAQIRGEHVARVLEVEEHEGMPYVVMELLEGSDLGETLAVEGALGVTEAVDAVLEACTAVAEAHLLGIIHRDLKPSNLFRARKPDGSTSIKVLDFGISKRDEPDAPVLTHSHTGLGTPLYMAPEQIRDARNADARADIWSLGVVLYELVADARPFDGASVTAVSARILEDEPVPLAARCPAAPPELAAVVVRCLAKDRDERYCDVAELAQALSPFASDAGKSAARSVTRLLAGSGDTVRQPLGSGAASSGTSATASAWARASSKGARRAGGVVAAVAIALGLVAWLALRERSEAPTPADTAPAVEAPPSAARLPVVSTSAPSASASATASASASSPPRPRAQPSSNLSDWRMK